MTLTPTLTYTQSLIHAFSREKMYMCNWSGVSRFVLSCASCVFESGSDCASVDTATGCAIGWDFPASHSAFNHAFAPQKVCSFHANTPLMSKTSAKNWAHSGKRTQVLFLTYTPALFPLSHFCFLLLLHFLLIIQPTLYSLMCLNFFPFRSFPLWK